MTSFEKQNLPSLSDHVTDRVRLAIGAAISAGIAAVEPSLLTKLRVPEDLTGVRVLALGKAAAAMSRGAYEALGDRVVGGVAVCSQVEPVPDRMRLVLGSHPFPDERSVAAGWALLEEARLPGDLLVLVSGGASALAEVPPAGLTVEVLARLQADLMAVGLPISQLNLVRRHLSEVKNGGLLRAAGPKRVVTLLVSDVADGQPSDIASGPTLPDGTTRREALAVIDEAGVAVHASVREHLQKEVEQPFVSDHEWGVIASGADAIHASRRSLISSGFHTRIYDDPMTGNANDKARHMVACASSGDLLLATGETTVHVTGVGLGGRNQHAALSAAIALDGAAGCFAAVGTDGIDGPTSAAGAVVDGETASRARMAGVDPVSGLKDCDSHSVLKASGDLVIMGPTGTNVGDLWMAWMAPWTHGTTV